MCALSLAAWCPTLSDLSKRMEELLEVYTSVLSTTVQQGEPWFPVKRPVQRSHHHSCLCPWLQRKQVPAEVTFQKQHNFKNRFFELHALALPHGVPTAHVSGCSSLVLQPCPHRSIIPIVLAGGGLMNVHLCVGPGGGTAMP